MKKIQMAIRIILGLVMVFFIYRDAGLTVSIFAFLVLFSIEAETLINSMQRDINDIFHNRIKELENHV